MTDKKNGTTKEKLTFERSEASKGFVVLKLIGDLDMWTLPLAKERINGLVQEGKVKIVLDLERMNYIDSSGLGFFIGSLKKLRDAGGDLILINLNAYIYGIFKLIQLQHIIQTYDSLEEASKHF
ncbi:MAG TPA: STAS domain-containing protein [Candidatus Ozemobacteraceae bacterium]|nr:STAS domain-containing protein [Candidatus Ozemobacteraceae bacterium]HQG27127.1 STAS domain-containing protein [Candidatus Ozemobacteraceae bacterium]